MQFYYLNFNEKKFSSFFQKSPIIRIGWNRFLRNIIIASGNSNNKNLIDHIYKHYHNKNSIIRGACNWALFQLLDEKEKELAHTLNGSALALPRIVAAIIENNHSTEGIKIPKILQEYTGFKFIS